MTVLSLTQPWASALFSMCHCPPKKTIETRAWQTSYRGVLYIHASKGFPKWAKTMAADEGFTPECLPLGCIIGSVFLKDIKPTEEIRSSLSDLELSWGDYADGRFAWIFERPMRLKEPIKAKGALSLWKYEVPT